MEKRQLGKTDMDVTVLGFGGSEIGYERVAQDSVDQLLNSALDADLNVIDTAECYYHSEELIGRAVGKRRNDFYLFTKCGHPHGMESSANWSKSSILASVQRSLHRLQTDFVDLVQLHSCSESELRHGEAIEALQTARERGFTRYIGYSGDSRAAHYAVDCGAFDTLQTSINIADQEALELTLPIARQKQVGVIAKRPIANVAWKTGHRPRDSYHHEYWERLRRLNYQFLRNRPVEETIATALRFTLSVPGVHTAIVGTTKPERWQQNAGMIEAGPLPEIEFQAIRDRWEEYAPRTWIGQI
ncbi:MAG TPA: aldo/keto reductase [Chthoniobacterales bacterium]|jgi:aryl-alcohol dehydrogenase-like predicted oxidoreductase|nr:aldo/keto reductase [Chthoniobacterales bacterium]